MSKKEDLNKLFDLSEKNPGKRVTMKDVKKAEEGRKFDGEKPDWSLIRMKQLEGLADVLTYGAKKYDRHNWVNVEPYRYFAALQRHITAWQDGEDNDQESGLNHLHHAMANLYFLLEHECVGDRYKFQGEK